MKLTHVSVGAAGNSLQQLSNAEAATNCILCISLCPVCVSACILFLLPPPDKMNPQPERPQQTAVIHLHLLTSLNTTHKACREYKYTVWQAAASQSWGVQQ